MPSPFPGMDPYLEDNAGWPDVHHRLLTTIGDQLADQVSPHFIVRIEERVYITDELDDPGYPKLIPDVVVTTAAGRPSPVQAWPSAATITAPVLIDEWLEPEIHDYYLEIRDARSHEVVTAVELLSPANKVRHSRGWMTLREKQQLLHRGGVNWVEIDLLRAGERPRAIANRSDYCVTLVRPGQPGANVWFIGLRDPLPIVAVPLRPAYPDVPLDLQRALRQTYDRAHYADSLDYSQPPPPPLLKPADAAWAKRLVKAWQAAR